MASYSKKRSFLKPVPLAVSLACANLVSGSILAQEAPKRGSQALLEEVTVTARKREEGVQDVPLSVTAYNSEQIDALKVRGLASLAFGMPNVSLDEIGTFKGVANFSIRGLGINSSIPSIDPTVGVFVDGVYLGTNMGIIFDAFDLASIEVLRGPQGILFGRNVTGGAVLLNSNKPGDEFESTIRAAVDTGGSGGYNKYLMGTVGGPLSDNLLAKVTGYYNDDEGWFTNESTGDDFGGIEQKMIRPSLIWRPTEDIELYLKYEYSDIEGEGIPGQSHTNGSGVDGTPNNWDRDSFKFSINADTFQKTETNLFSAQLDWSVGENGTITNIFGVRDLDNSALSDIDGQPVSLFHAPIWLESEQVSNELRYNGLFMSDKLNFTTGLYYFKHDLKYHERRNLLGALTPDGSPAQTQDGGGEYEVETLGVFLAMDYDLNDAWTLSAGVRYTVEEKDAKVASLPQNVNAPCNIVTAGDCPFDFEDDESWSNWSPKLGALYTISDDARIYAHWSRGYRSGGYNLRNASADPINFGPGPFDEEQVDNYEIGFKSEFTRGRLNGALFFNQIKDQQREVADTSPIAGVVQTIRNTADTDILGFELEGTFMATDEFLILASVGYTDAEYQKVRFDINRDGVIDDLDLALDLPRAPEWTYSLGFSWDVSVADWGYMTARGNYAYRDWAAISDNNLSFNEEQEMVEAGLDFYSNSGHWVLSLYGKNLLDEVSFGGDTQLPATLGGQPLGGTSSALNKGRHYGVEVTYNF
jgi:iron complex outermembrane recepter protein